MGNRGIVVTKVTSNSDQVRQSGVVSIIIIVVVVIVTVITIVVVIGIIVCCD